MFIFPYDSGDIDMDQSLYRHKRVCSASRLRSDRQAESCPMILANKSCGWYGKTGRHNQEASWSDRGKNALPTTIHVSVRCRKHRFLIRRKTAASDISHGGTLFQFPSIQFYSYRLAVRYQYT
jgi:hypothetical protein